MPITKAIVESVAESKGVEHTDLEPLHDSIDSDVILPLIESANDEASFNFQYEDHSVTVTGDKRVSITPT